MLSTHIVFSAFVAVALAQFGRRREAPSRRPLCYAEDRARHDFTLQEDDLCQAPELADAWEEEMGRSYCKPRAVLVMLNTDAEHQFHPPAVEAARCVGQCRFSTCSPVLASVTTRRVQVTLTNELHRNTSCGFVEVEQHTECECRNTVGDRISRAGIPRLVSRSQYPDFD